MLQDLRTINSHMELIGAPFRGLPWVPTVPSQFHLTVIDLKDCFFSVPFHEEDCEKFAFCIPTPLNLMRDMNGLFFHREWPIVWPFANNICIVSSLLILTK